MKIQVGTIAILAFAVMGLAACSSGPDEDASPVVRAPQPSAPAVSQPYNPPAEAPAPAQSPAYHPVAEDQCGAAALQSLIGKPRTDIPVPLYPNKRRVVCSTCVMTQEFRADRQTIVFDSDTGLITSVKCG